MFQNKLCELSSEILSKAERLIIAGDIHGDYESFQDIQGIFNPKSDYLIFLGDYADRGQKGIEVIDGIRQLVLKNPHRVAALKGNHEDYTEKGQPKFMPCDLIFEADEKKGGWDSYFMDELSSFVNQLYLAVIVPGEVLFVHGGISTRIEGINDLQDPSRLVEEDILWSDPFDGLGEHPNIRGAGIEFGKDVSQKVCRRIGVKRIVRSHQPRKAWDKPYLEHEEKVITVSSTTVYGGTPFILSIQTENMEESFEKIQRNYIRLR